MQTWSSPPLVATQRLIDQIDLRLRRVQLQHTFAPNSPEKFGSTAKAVACGTARLSSIMSASLVSKACAGYVLCRQPEGCWTHLPADLHRHLYQGKLC